MKTVFVVWHVHTFDEGHEEIKLIGIFTSRDKVEAALNHAREQLGYRNTPDGFSIEESVLDRADWIEGYVTASPDDSFSD